MEWQPLSTAPTDGTEIWFRAANGYEGICRFYVNCWCHWRIAFNDEHQPIEWRPLTEELRQAERVANANARADAMRSWGTGRLT